MIPGEKMSSKIVLRYLDGKDKITLLNEVLDLSGFDDTLEAVRSSLGRERDAFNIAIKPNASMFVRRDDDGVTTDPLLVLALVERLHGKGYRNINVVESSNAYDMTFSNRNPITVMTAMGLNGGVHAFTSARAEMTSHIAGPDGRLLPYKLVDLGAEVFEVRAGAAAHVDPDAAFGDVDGGPELGAAFEEPAAEVVVGLGLSGVEAFHSGGVVLAANGPQRHVVDDFQVG